MISADANSRMRQHIGFDVEQRVAFHAHVFANPQLFAPVDNGLPYVFFRLVFLVVLFLFHVVHLAPHVADDLGVFRVGQIRIVFSHRFEDALTKPVVRRKDFFQAILGLEIRLRRAVFFDQMELDQFLVSVFIPALDAFVEKQLVVVKSLGSRR